MATFPEPEARLAAAATRWSLTDPVLIAETATSWVNRVAHTDGQRALKLLKPYGLDEIVGARFLDWCGGRGAARLFGVGEDVILMEWLAGEPLADLVRGDANRDADATRFLCEVIIELHAPRPSLAPKLTSLRAQFRRLRESDLAFVPAPLRPLWQRAQAMLEALIATTTAVVPLHGDLHHDNVIGASDAWRAIDPKGLVGDPHYEVANIFRNPHGADELAVQPERIDALARTFAGRLGLDRRRILGWAAVHSAISAAWDHAAGNPFDWDLKMLPLLLSAVDRS